jgi:hypothetical protein
LLKELAPGLKLGEESGQVHAHVPCAEPGEFSRALLEQRATPYEVFARLMMKRRRDLDQAMEKYLVVAFGLEPDGFQDFMRFEEFPSIEQVNPFFGGRIRHGSSALKTETLSSDFHRNIRRLPAVMEADWKASGAPHRASVGEAWVRLAYLLNTALK